MFIAIGLLLLCGQLDFVLSNCLECSAPSPDLPAVDKSQCQLWFCDVVGACQVSTVNVDSVCEKGPLDSQLCSCQAVIAGVVSCNCDSPTATPSPTPSPTPAPHPMGLPSPLPSPSPTPSPTPVPGTRFLQRRCRRLRRRRLRHRRLRHRRLRRRHLFRFCRRLRRRRLCRLFLLRLRRLLRRRRA